MTKAFALAIVAATLCAACYTAGLYFGSAMERAKFGAAISERYIRP